MESEITGLPTPDSDTVWKADIKNSFASRFARIPGRTVMGIIAGSDGAEVWNPDTALSIVVAAIDERTRQCSFWRVPILSGTPAKLYEDKISLSPPHEFGLNVDVSSDGTTIVYYLESARQPQEIWIADASFSDRTPLTQINQMGDVQFGETRPFEYYSIDGTRLHGALLLPSGYREGSEYPLVVWVYSGSYLSTFLYRFGVEAGDSRGASLNLQVLAAHGYAVLIPDAPVNVGTPKLDLLKTVMPAIDRVIDLGVADPDRIGIMGHSYGGYSTLVLLEQTRRFKAAVDYAGISDLVSYYGWMQPDGEADSTGYLEAGQGGMGGTPWEFRNRYIENSPFFYLDRIETPLLIIQGEADTAVPYRQSDEVFVGLRRLNKEAQYVTYAGEPHVLADPNNIVDYWNRVLSWFDKYLKLEDSRLSSNSSGH